MNQISTLYKILETRKEKGGRKRKIKTCKHICKIIKNIKICKQNYRKERCLTINRFYKFTVEKNLKWLKITKRMLTYSRIKRDREKAELDL